MITKERLQQLIEKEVTIYILNHLTNTIKIVLLYKKDYIDIGFSNKEIYVNNNPESIFYGVRYKLEDLFETKEEAEFVLKFHTSKTIYFEPPTWEEFLKTETDIRRPNYTCENVMIIDYDNEIIVEDCNNDLTLKHFSYNKELNNRKQKYYEAVEYAKKLFLGEEK